MNKKQSISNSINDSRRFDVLSKKDVITGEITKNINNLITKFPTNDRPEPDATMILSGIWLGNCIAAHDSNFVRSKNIKYIINATDVVPNKFQSITYVKFSIRDDDACQENLLESINYCADIIHKAKSENNAILIHCKKGHHRSAAIVAFYLMKYHNISLIDAVYMIKSFRPTTFVRMTCMLKSLICYQASKY